MAEEQKKRPFPLRHKKTSSLTLLYFTKERERRKDGANFLPEFPAQREFAGATGEIFR